MLSCTPQARKLETTVLILNFLETKVLSVISVLPIRCTNKMWKEKVIQGSSLAAMICSLQECGDLGFLFSGIPLSTRSFVGVEGLPDPCITVICVLVVSLWWPLDSSPS